MAGGRAGDNDAYSDRLQEGRLSNNLVTAHEASVTSAHRRE